MDESQRNALALQRDIADKRDHLVSDIERLRAAVRLRFSPRAQLRAHPRIALGLGLGLVLSLPLILLAFAARALLVRRRRRSWSLRP